MSAKSVCVNDYEEKAKRILPKAVFDYYISGADDEETLADNVAAFSRWKFCPRVLRDVSKVDLSVSVLGQQISMPVCVAATAMQRMAHPDGETATARACRAEGTGMTLSSWATSTIEEVAAVAPGGLRWMQLYIYKDRDLTLSLVRRAEKAGYKGIFVTVDTPYLGRRRNDVRNQFKLPSNLSMVNFESPDLAFSSKENFGEDNGLALYVAQSIDPSLKWEDIAWLKSMTTLPVVLKGILTAEDAKEALKYGIDGILVSNHGARQLDGVLATGSPTPVLESYYPIGFLSYLASDEPHLFFGKYQQLVWLIRSQIDALPEIVEAVGGRVEVFLDGGVRRGTDVLKALALGARAVFLGRPILWGLSCDGEKGVREILHLVREELRLAVALTGCRSLKEVSRSILKKSGMSSRI